MKKILIPLLAILFQASYAQYPLKSHPFSTQSEDGFSPCRDTFTFLKRNTGYDLNLMLPTWLPVIDKNYVVTLEGKVAYNTTDGTGGPHIAEEDLPFCHYSHDVDFDVMPDKTEDNRFTNLLAFLVYNKPNGKDTSIQSLVHCEWECGLGMANRMNPLRGDNDAGNSGGFFSAGHEMGDVIWNWPSPGDWVHVEGNYAWDRGHPPSEAEIHPPRFIAIKRLLSNRVIIGDSSIKFATRVDIFASGDGTALLNNRFDAPNYVRRVNMSSKDYEVTVKMDIPRPSAKAHLHFTLTRHKGDNFSLYEMIEVNDDSGTAHISIPWMTRNAHDLEIYARTLNFYWDEGNGAPADVPIDVYKVKLTGIRFARLNEFLTKAEIRMFSNVGSDWVFLNDFFPKKGKILSRGLGKTYKHKWTLNNEFMVYVPRGKNFRVYMAGWEVDGVDILFGSLIDPDSPCNRKTKREIKKRIFSFNMVLNGCFDDNYGETSKMHSYDNLGKIDRFTNSPQKGMNDDPCPGSKFPLKDRVFLSYTIEKQN